MIQVFHSVFGKIFQILFLPFQNMSPWAGMIVVSLLTGLLMLFIFRLTSDQEGIRRTKDRIKAHLLELRLYKDSLPVTLKAQGHLFRCNLKYLSHSVKPLLVMIVPVLLILIHLNFWFGYESLNRDETAILKVKLDKGRNPLNVDLLAEPPEGIILETLPLRIEETREVNWRLRAVDEGIHEVNFRLDGATFIKKVAVGGKPLARVAPARVSRGFINELFNPAEPSLPRNLPVKAVEITYPPNKMNFFGLRLHWLIAFFALSIIFGFSLKGVFKVEL